MAINIRTSGYQKRERVAAPLDAYASTLQTLQQKHDTTIETQNKIKEFLANKKLNEAESKWLADYSAKINAQIEGAAEEGSYATALTTARKMAGEVASNPGLIGRERYQQEYKKFQDEVTSSKDYDADVKAYTLEQNKYAYKDEVDDKGNVVGGTSFQPNYRPAEQIDYNQLYSKVLQTVGVDSSAGESLVWGDVDGNIKGTQGDIAAGDIPYLKTGAGIQRLSPDKIRMAMEAAINETPGARASLDQDYRINVWKASKGRANIVTNPDGSIMNQKQFEENLFADRYKASAYTQTKSTIDTSVGFQMMAAAARKSSGKGTGKQPELLPSFSTIGGKEKVEPDTPAKVASTLNDLNSKMGNMFAEYGISKNIPFDQAYSELRSKIANNGILSDEAKRTLLGQASKYYDDIQKANNRLDATKNRLNRDEQFAVDFLGKRMSIGEMSNSSNPLQKSWMGRMNNLFTTSDGQVLDTVLVDTWTNTDRANILNGLRINMGLNRNDVSQVKIGNKEYIRVSRDAYMRLAPEMTELFKNSKLGFTKGEIVPNNFELANVIYGSKAGGESLRNIYNRALRLSQNATERISKSLPVNYVDLEVFDQPPHVLASGMGFEADQFKDYNERIMNTLSIADPTSIVIKKRDENGVLQDVTDARDKQAIMQVIQAQIKKKNLNNGWCKSNSTGDYGVFLNVPFTPKTGKNQAKNPQSDMEDRIQNAVAGDYMITGALFNDEIERFKSLPNVRAMDTMGSIKYNTALKTNYRLSDAEFGDGTMSAVTDGDFCNIYDLNGNQIMRITKNELTKRISQNYATNAILAPVKSNADMIAARNGSVASSPVEEQASIAQPIMQKAMIMAGVTGNLSDTDVDTRREICKYFNQLYHSVTGEAPSNYIIGQLNDLMK